MNFKIRISMRIMSLTLALVFLIPLAANNKIATVTAENDARIIAIGVPDRVFRGDTFDVTLRFENNPGFMTMPIRLYVPQGLVLTHITFDSDYSAVLSQGFTGPPGFIRATGEITPIVGPAYAFVGWARTNNMIMQNFNLITYTFMAEEDAALGETDKIRINFANVRAPELPANSNRERLTINLPGDNGEIGSVIIEEPPFRIKNFNVSNENIVSFNATNATAAKDLFLIAAKYDNTGRLFDVYIREINISAGFNGLWVEVEPVQMRFDETAKFMLWDARTLNPLVRL